MEDRLLRFRCASPRDHATFLRLFSELGVDDRPPDAEKFARDLVPGTWIAERGGAAVGYCWCEELGGEAYVRHLVVAPDARGDGVGRALLHHVATHARSRGMRAWRLNVKPDNVAAIGLYRSVGLRVAYESQALVLPWAALARLGGEAASLGARVLASDEATWDRAIEDAFGLPVGQVARARRPGIVPIVVTDPAADQPVAFAAFDPAFPGAFPFRCRRVTLARPLLEEMRRHARANDESVGVVIEDDAALSSLLVGLGARVRLDLLHMTGPL